MRISDWSSDVCSSVLTRGQKTERQEASGASTQSELMHPNSAFRPRQDDLAELLVREVGLAAVFASTPDGPRVAHAPVVLSDDRPTLQFHLAPGPALTPHPAGANALPGPQVPAATARHPPPQGQSVTLSE